MKFMPQDVFDTSVLLLLREGYSGGEMAKALTLNSIVTGYRDMYTGDQDFVPQMKRAVAALEAHYGKKPPSRFSEILTRAAEVRMELDENMKRKGAVKKLFAGAVFRSSHPAPQIRAAQAEAHVKHLVDLVRNLPPFVR